MGIKQKFTVGDFPPVNPATFLDEPLRDRLHTLATHWSEYGAGGPRQFHLAYIIKFTLVWALLGIVLITWTSGLGWFWQVDQWWDQPIVYQKLIIWTMFFEAFGIGAGWGPNGTNFKPFLGGVNYWARPGTIRLRPFTWVPGTAGDTRTVFDVVLYVGFLLSLLTALLMPGVPNAGLTAVLPENTSGLVNVAPVIAALVFLCLLGLRDKVAFLGARSDQYLWALLFFVTLGAVDMIIALKLLLVIVWVGAAISKIGYHFALVVPPMVSNTPFWPPRALKRAMYRNVPDDLRPSGLAKVLAHYGGIVVELVAPLVLLFSTNQTVTVIAVVLMLAYCLFIVSTFPLAVPLEWNLLFMYAVVFLFLGLPNSAGFGLSDFSNVWLLVAIVALMVVLPIVGNFWPSKVSFLWSLRQYSGNWATSMWTFTPGAEAKLNQVTRAAGNQVDQLQQLGIPAPAAEITMQQIVAWRSMHSQGRGLLSVLYRFLPDLESRTIREGENVCTTLVGWNFGDGHLHTEPLIEAVQARCHFAPGELVVVLAESSPIHKPVQRWRLVDAALGEVASGAWDVRDCVAEKPWLPNGPISLDVTRVAADWTPPGQGQTGPQERETSPSTGRA